MNKRSLIASARNRSLFLAIALTLALLPYSISAADITLQGTFRTDDAVQRFNVDVGTAGSVDFRSYGYAGGTTSAGTVVPAGGFDTVLTLFSASRAFINENDDGAGVATDPSTGFASDARLTTNLSAGTYILTLTQYDSFSLGGLAAGFAETGNPNFTADGSFASGGPCPGNMFRDVSGSDGRCRTGNWAVSFGNVTSVTPAAAVPEPSALLFTGLGLGILLLMRVRRYKRRTKLLLASSIASIAVASPALAQTNPDFSTTNDILRGRRTLLQTTDLVIPFYVDNDQIQLNVVNTSNSQQANAPPFPDLGSGDSSKPLKTVTAHMFNQPQAITITPVYNYQHSALFTLNLLNIASLPSKSTIWQPRPAGDEPTVNCMAVGDFNLDGYEDLALSDIHGRMLLMFPNDPNDATKGFHSSETALDALREMVVGDFNGDGRQEIAGLKGGPNGGLTLVIYTIDPKNFTLAQASSINLTTPGATAGTPIAYTSMAKGKFNSRSHDQIGVTFATGSGSPTVEVIDFTSGTLTPSEASSLVPTTATVPYGYLQLQAGKFGLPANPYDQIVWHISSGAARFFQIISADPTDLKLTVNPGVTYNQFGCAAGLTVGNYDHQQPDPLHAGQNLPNPNSQIAFLYCNNQGDDYGHPLFSLNIYSADPTTFAIGNPDSSTGNFLPTQQSSQFVFPTILATDVQGRSMILGEPTKFTISNTSPTVITAAPPMHIDYITPLGGNKPEVLNVSYIPDGYYSSFSLTQESTTGGSTTHNLSWSAGVDFSSQYDYQIGDPDEGTGARFSAGFHAASDFTGSSDSSNVNYSTSTFDATKTAKTADVVIFDDSRTNVWSYPVIGQTVCPATDCSGGPKPLTIQFSGPDQVDSGSVSADLLSATWYQPTWEWGNVLSYPATLDQLKQIYPSFGNDPNLQLSTGLSFDTDNSSTDISATWSASTEQGATSSLANTTSFDVTLSGVDAVGVTDVAGTKVSASLKLSGSVGLSKLQTNSAKINASNGVNIQAVGKFLDPGNYAYQVQPLILGNPPPAGVSGVSSPYQQPAATVQTFGPLKTAFTANPVSTGAWWSGSAYSQYPDVALNHPSRWIPTNPAVGDTLPSNCRNYGKGSSDVDCADIAPYYTMSGAPLNPWNSEFMAMRGFFVTRADSPGVGPQLGFANAGDQLDLAVRVYNYSLQPVTQGSHVHVRFYAMPWNGNTNVQAGNSLLVGEAVIDPVLPFDPTSSVPNWVLVHSPSPFNTTSLAGQFFTFWVVVWMEDNNGNLVPELPGHGLTSKPGTLNSPTDVPLEMAKAANGSTTVSYSNNVGFYHYAFPVLGANPGPDLGTPPPDNTDDVSFKNISAADRRIQPGQVDEITATLRAGVDGSGSLKVYFYDGDPDAGGQLIGLETARLKPRTTTKVRLPFHAPKDGIHQIWAVINKGKPNQLERHTAAILVGTATANRNSVDGDNPPADKGGLSQ